MRVTIIGRLHFLVDSRSEWEEEQFLGEQPPELTGRIRKRHLVDLEPQENGGPFFCSCKRFNESHYYHGQPCHHIKRCQALVTARAAVLKARKKLKTHEQTAKTTPPTDRKTIHPPRKYVLAGAIPRRRADPPQKHRDRR